jgi:hypothetical protein
MGSTTHGAQSLARFGPECGPWKSDPRQRPGSGRPQNPGLRVQARDRQSLHTSRVRLQAPLDQCRIMCFQRILVDVQRPEPRRTRRHRSAWPVVLRFWRRGSGFRSRLRGRLARSWFSASPRVPSRRVRRSLRRLTMRGCRLLDRPTGHVDRRPATALEGATRLDRLFPDRVMIDIGATPGRIQAVETIPPDLDQPVRGYGQSRRQVDSSRSPVAPRPPGRGRAAHWRPGCRGEPDRCRSGSWRSG